MPDALPGGASKGVRFQRSPSAHATPAPVAQAQGGLTLGPEEGELDADFCHLGKLKGHTSIAASFFTGIHTPKKLGRTQY
jgi:hypothetical protein